MNAGAIRLLELLIEAGLGAAVLGQVARGIQAVVRVRTRSAANRQVQMAISARSSSGTITPQPRVDLDRQALNTASHALETAS